MFERNTLKIVELDILSDEFLDFGSRGKVSAVQVVVFQGTKEIFCYCIFVTVSEFGHRGRNAVL